MTPENFCYWLQGVFEVGGATELDGQQTQVIKDHLALVFDKKTPTVPVLNPFPSQQPTITFPPGARNEEYWVKTPLVDKTPIITC